MTFWSDIGFCTSRADWELVSVAVEIYGEVFNSQLVCLHEVPLVQGLANYGPWLDLLAITADKGHFSLTDTLSQLHHILPFLIFLLFRWWCAPNLLDVPILEVPNEPLNLLIAPLKLDLEHIDSLIAAKRLGMTFLEDLSRSETPLLQLVELSEWYYAHRPLRLISVDLLVLIDKEGVIVDRKVSLD